MKHLFFGLAFALVLNSLVIGQAGRTENWKEYAFSENGSVRLQLTSGDYVVRSGYSDRVVVTWQAENFSFEKDMKKIKVRADIAGTIATIRTSGPTKHARITIEVPALSDLYLRIRAGDVRISGIEGNKDVHMTAGDLKIDVVPNSYSCMRASVTLGDLRARAVGVSKDGIRNSFSWTGPGKYRLNASLFAGDLSLERESIR